MRRRPPPPSITVAPADELDAFEPLLREFLAKVLGYDLDDCLLTDESRLSDFVGAGLTDEEAEALTDSRALYSYWDTWVAERVRKLYGVADVTASMTFVVLMQRITERRQTRLQ